MWQWIIVAVVVLLVPASASATVLTYYPGGSAASTSNDLGDLDHQFYYAWTITGIPIVPAGQQISSAYVTFRNLYNWDNTANMLYMDLMNNASSGPTPLSTNNGSTSGYAYISTIRNAQDSTQVPVTTFNDAFDSANSLGGSTSSGNTVGINLTEHAFLPGDSVNLTYNDPSQASDITWLQNLLTSAGLPGVDAQFGAANPQWTFGPNGTGWDYTYNFTSSQLSTLTSYINGAPSGTITLAFDPDCHFFNDGVSLTLVTGSIGTTSAVPEPASLILLGTGLLFTANRYRRRRMAGIPTQK